MIRFINLTGQILVFDDTEPHFAWYDTIVDRFMEFNDSQEWHTWEEFDADLVIEHHRQNINIDETMALLVRFKKLFPKTHPTNSFPS